MTGMKRSYLFSSTVEIKPGPPLGVYKLNISVIMRKPNLYFSSRSDVAQAVIRINRDSIEFL